jgi:Restriction endonuclease S subunits
MAKLGEICKINMGQSPDSSTYNNNKEGIPFFQGNADFGKINPTIRLWCSNPVKIAKENDILISVRAPIGALNISDCECCIGRGLASLTITTDKCIQKFLWYSLINRTHELISKGTGSTFKAINKQILFDLKIPLPPLEEQEKIAMVLDKVSELIEKREQQLAKLDELIKSRFVEMFGDPVTNEKKWDKVPLSELAEIRIGPFGSLLHKEDYITDGYPLVNPSHIVNEKIVTDKKLTISKQKYNEMKVYHLKINDVVLGRRGEMGRCAVVTQSGLICGTGSLLIRSYGKITANFIQKIISFPTFKKTIEDMAIGQTMPNLNVSIVANFQIIIPPLEIQQRYFSFVEQTEKIKVAINSSLDKLRTLKKALMQRFFG